MSELKNTPSGIDPYGQFMDELEANPVTILPQSEVAKKVEALRSPHTPAEIKALLQQELTRATLPMIPYAISQFAPKFIPPEELIGVAYEALQRGIANYHPEGKSGEPVTFGHYMFRTLELRLRGFRELIDPSIPVSVPEEAHTAGNALRRSWRTLAQQLQREPTPTEVLTHTEQHLKDRSPQKWGDSTRDVLEWTDFWTVRKPIVRIGKYVGRGYPDPLQRKEVLLGDIANVLTDDLDTPYTHALSSEMADALHNAIDQLPEPMRVAFRLRCGLNNEGRNYLLAEIGEILGMRRETVQEKITRAFYILSRKRDLKRFLESD